MISERLHIIQCVSVLLTLPVMDAMSTRNCGRQPVFLDDLQASQIQRNRSTIHLLENHPNFLKLSRFQRPIVKLTPEQQHQILEQGEGIFSSVEDLPSHSVLEYVPTSGPNSNSDPSPGRIRRISRSAVENPTVRVCEVEAGLQAISLALNADGELVQLVQFPELQQQQWIFEERCLFDTCSGVQGGACQEVARSVKAMVINFKTRVITDSWIQAHCCICKRRLSLG
ncbi:uncharacterized protein [Ptychodera flava]